jgi:hypothetical protein
VFIVFSLTAMDFAAFSGKYSIMYRIAGDASQTAPFDLNTHLTVMRDHTGAVYSGAPPCTPNCRPIIATIAKPFAYVKASSNPTPTPIAGTAVGGVVDKLAWSRCNPKEIEKDATGVLKTICGFSYPISGMLQNVNWDVMAAARTPVVDIGTLPAVEWVENEDGTLNPDLTRGKQIAREVLSALAFCCMVVFLLNGILAVVPMITGDILGDFGQSANLSQSFAQVASNPVGNIASRVGGGAQQALGKIMGKG